MKKVLCVCVILAMVLGLAACQINGVTITEYAFKTDNFVESAGDYTPTSDVSDITVDWVAGNVYVSEGTGDKLTVRETAVGESAKVHFYYRMNSSGLTVAFAKNGTRVSKITKDLTITLPKGKSVNLHIASIAATIHVDAGRMGEVSLESVSGRVECKVPQVEHLSVESVSGPVNLISSAREIKVETVSGNVQLSCAQMFERLSVETVSGNATIDIPQDASFTLSVETVSGNVSTGPFACTVSGSRYIVGTGKATITASSTSGNVTLK